MQLVGLTTFMCTTTLLTLSMCATTIAARRPAPQSMTPKVDHNDAGADAISLLMQRKSVRRTEVPIVEHNFKSGMQGRAKTTPQTTWHCVGEDAEHRHCIFKNLYYSALPGGRDPGFMMFVTKDQKTNDVELLRADKYDYKWKPRAQEFSSMTEMEDFVSSSVLLEEPGLSVQFNPLFHQNIGHAIFDGLYPAYLAMIALGRSDQKFRPVVSVDAGCFDDHSVHKLEPGALIETYVPDPEHGRSLRAVQATVKGVGSLMQQEQQRTCKFEQGFDSRGEELGAQPASSDKDCCNACSSTFGCKSAVLLGSTCYLKGKCSSGKHCAVSTDNSRLLCTLKDGDQEQNITVLAAGGTSEVSVPESWVVGLVRRRCMSEGVFETFGRSGEMRRLFEMDRDMKANPNLLLRFEEIIFGVGGAGNMIADKSGAIGGSQPPTQGMSLFRDRMYAAYDIPINNEKPKPGSKLNVMVVSNKRFRPEDHTAIDKALQDVGKQDEVFGDVVDWSLLGQPDTKFRDHLKRVSQADVYVSSIGTALQYVPFMRDGRVYVALGSIWKRSQRLFPTFMEQQLAGAGTPYLRTLYADPGSILRQQKPENPGAMLMDLGEDGYAANVDATSLVDLLQQAQTLVRDGFNVPVPAEENLSKEGRLIVELCKKDPDTCERMQADRNGGNSQCSALLWNECIVYEVGPWAKGCHVNTKLLRQLRKEHGLFSYGAPEF